MQLVAKYQNLVIYYFSGTGNARQSAEWIAGVASSMNVRTALVNIDRFNEISIPELSEGRTLIGFAYPTHGFNAAPIMLRFITQFPTMKNCDVFLLNTRAGMKLSKIFLPGLSGLAQYIPAFILTIKGFRVVAMKPVDLPSNWISLHPGLKEKVVVSIFRRWEAKLKRFAARTLAGEKTYRALFELPIDVLLFPVAIGYYLIGRYALAKTFIALDSCNACGICMKQCPTQSIKMLGDYPYWKLTCESCMRCMNSCPQRAIETAHTISGIIWYLAWAIVTPLVFAWIINTHVFPEPMNAIWARLLYWAVFGVITIIFVCAGYRIMHYLLRFRAFNRLIAFTSLTHFRFWRRYKVPPYKSA